MKRQRGLTTVEFALVGPVALLVLLGCIEVGRAFYAWNTIHEATRRGARVAAVTTSDSTGQTTVQDAVLAYGTIDRLQRTNISVNYYDSSGTASTDPSTIAFVTVKVSGLTHSFLIPFVGRNITMPDISTTLPTESLGVAPPT